MSEPKLRDLRQVRIFWVVGLALGILAGGAVAIGIITSSGASAFGG